MCTSGSMRSAHRSLMKLTLKGGRRASRHASSASSNCRCSLQRAKLGAGRHGGGAVGGWAVFAVGGWACASALQAVASYPQIRLAANLAWAGGPAPGNASLAHPYGTRTSAAIGLRGSLLRLLLPCRRPFCWAGLRLRPRPLRPA